MMICRWIKGHVKIKYHTAIGQYCGGGHLVMAKVLFWGFTGLVGGLPQVNSSEKIVVF